MSRRGQEANADLGAIMSPIGSRLTAQLSSAQGDSSSAVTNPSMINAELARYATLSLLYYI
jgi:hypothetical protein